MTKTDLIQLIQDRAAGGDVTSDTLQKYKDVTIAATLNAILTEIGHTGKNIFSNSAFGISYSALTGNYYITLSPKPIGGALGVKYVQDDCGNTYYGRKSVDQNFLLSQIKPMALPEFFVNAETLTFTAEPKGTSYTVYMTPDFVAMDDETEFSCSDPDSVITAVIEKIKATNNEPTEKINNTKPDRG